MKAKRATIAIGTMEIDVFQLPDGSYRMSQTQVAETVGKKELSFRQFFQSKWLKALPGIDPDSVNFTKIEREDEAGAAISGVPLLFASAYWLKEAIAKNKQAQILAWACMAETLTRRADAAFGVTRSDDKYQAKTAELMTVLDHVARERDVLLENYDIDDDARQLADAAWSEVTRLEAENERLREQLRRYQ